MIILKLLERKNIKMAKQVPWTRVILERFISEACLSELEEKVMRTRVCGWSRQRQCEEFNISMATLDRIIRRLKTKYDKVQKYDPILPPRRFGVDDTYKYFRG